MSGRADGRALVLVTGTPRSGTTPVGDALAAAPRARTLYEPLNFHVGDRRVSRYFEVPGAGGFTQETADELVRDVQRLRLRLRPGLFPEDHGLRRMVKRVTGSRTLATYRRCRLDPGLRTIVWKDPFAAFLAPRVAEVHQIPVVVTVRPPAAVAASFKRLGWGFDVADLIQRLGVDGQRYRQVLAGAQLDNPVHNGTVLWHVVNDWLLRMCGGLPDVHVVDLDQLVADRTATLRGLYQGLGLTWGPGVEHHLERTTSGEGPARPTSGRAHDAKRDAAAVNRYWSEVLDADEIAFVDRHNAGLWARIQATAAAPRS